jgi:hypothetical protein
MLLTHAWYVSAIEFVRAFRTAVQRMWNVETRCVLSWCWTVQCIWHVAFSCFERESFHECRPSRWPCLPVCQSLLIASVIQLKTYRQRSTRSRQQTAGSRQQAAVNRLQAAGSRQHASCSRQQVAGSRQQAAGSRQQAPNVDFSIKHSYGLKCCFSLKHLYAHTCCFHIKHSNGLNCGCSLKHAYRPKYSFTVFL